MSTAWYKSRCIPTMVRSFTAKKRRPSDDTSPFLTVQVWDTTCVVHNMPPTHKILINPANPQLTGVSKFAYFPVGGPQPTEPIRKEAHPIMGYVSQWGGMDVGNGMMFAATTVDGLVHQLGGTELQRQLQNTGSPPLAEGQAVATPTRGKLRESTPYHYIVHAVPPFYKLENNIGNFSSEETTTDQILADTYHNALHVAAKLNVDDHDDHTLHIATPLLGAGCRGFPTAVAINVAANAMMEWQSSPTAASRHITMSFAIPNSEIRQQLVEALEREMSPTNPQTNRIHPTN